MWFWNNIGKLSDMANVIIALITLFLGYYIFIYQKNKDEKDIEIQWLKDLIINPRIKYIEEYFDQMFTLKEKIKAENLDVENRSKLITLIKKRSSCLRNNFLIFIQNIAPILHKSISDKIDGLTDYLTDVFSNLEPEKIDESEINKEIQDTYSFILEQIFKYK